MQEIHLKLPEWAQNRNIYIFAGIEILGNFCVGNGNFWIKNKRCSLCGKCCVANPPLIEHKSADDYWTLEEREELKEHFKVETLTVCKYLDRQVWNFDEYDNQEVYPCTAPATEIPWSCMIGFTCGYEEWRKQKPFCKIEYEKRELNG